LEVFTNSYRSLADYPQKIQVSSRLFVLLRKTSKSTKSKMPKNEANLANSAPRTSRIVRGYHHLTEEEKNRLEVIASDDSQVVFYKPRRKKKKKRAAIDNSDHDPSPPRETREPMKKTPVAAAIDSKGNNVETVATIRSDRREQTSVVVRRQAEQNIRNEDREHQEPRSANTSPHQGRNKDRSKSAKSSASRVGYRTRSVIHCMTRYKAIKLAQVLLAMYVAILTFADIGPQGGLRDTETGLLVDQASPERTARGHILVNGTERPIVGATYLQVVCIGIARTR
jgi:hypothetical protein